MQTIVPVPQKIFTLRPLKNIHMYLYLYVYMPNVTLYIPQYLADNLSSEANKSGLVSQLLANYYAGKVRVGATETVMDDEKREKFAALKEKFPPLDQTVEPVEEAA